MDTFVRLHGMTAIERRVPGFWQLQFGGWVLLYVLSLAASAPHLRESCIFAYNTWDIVVLFAVTLALRPLLRFASQRWSTSWLQLQGRVFCICFLAGSLATYIISLITFGYRSFRLSYWTLSGVQCSLILFLWAALYLGVRQRNAVQLSLPVEQSSAPNTSFPCDRSEPVFATTFTVRTGNRLEMVPVDRVLWVAASRDYVELHTKNSTHLLRDTMTSLALRLDPSKFKRIHRSRIVRTDQIQALTPLDNGEFRVKLHDGSEHRSSRTYASVLTKWCVLGRENRSKRNLTSNRSPQTRFPSGVRLGDDRSPMHSSRSD